MAAAFSHVIFDLDGTILNTLEDLAAAGNHTCEAHGWPTFAVDEYRYKVGNGMLKLVERFMPAEYAGDGRMFEQTLAEFRAYYGEHKEDHTAPYAGTIETLDRLRAAGVQLAVQFLVQHNAHLAAACNKVACGIFGNNRLEHLVHGGHDQHGFEIGAHFLIY